MQASTITILTQSPLPVQIDGDPFGTTPIRFHTRSGRLWLLIPDGAPATLLGERPNDPVHRLGDWSSHG